MRKKQREEIVLDEFSLHVDEYPKESDGIFDTQAEPFVKGPIPLRWLRSAARIRGKSLAVGIALWYKAGLCKTKTVKATGRLWETFGIERKSLYPALRRLQKAGLISVEQHPGRNPLVTILYGDEF